MRTSSASSWTSAPGSSALQKGLFPPPHEDRHRPRHGQRPRLRQGQGHRHHRTVRRGGLRRQPDRRRGRGGPRDDRPHARQHPGDPADEGRRHRRLRHHRGDAPVLHRQGDEGPDRLLAAGGDDQRPGRRDVGREAGRPRRGAQGRRQGGLPDRGAARRRDRRERPDQRAVREHGHRHRRRHVARSR